MSQITNPILPGFNPDPAICRVGDDFYIATSTFEWFGGVQIHHSKDLVHWRLVGRAIDRLSQLDMTGDPDSGGVWAPCLTHADGTFWLVYSDTKSWQQGYKDVHNYVIWTNDIESGEWSDPHYLNSSGFDPSLFTDDDGRQWVCNQLWDHRSENHKFNGIVLQEYDHEQGKLVGPITKIFQNTPAMATEGPHIYKVDGTYFLVLAEGGTGRDHCVSVARSSSITGPYEVHPDNPILTSRDDLSLTLQKAGHASWCDTPSGEWYLAHLTSRPIDGCSILGRETAIQKLVWGEDGWPRLAQGGRSPAVTVAAPDLPAHPWPEQPVERTFTDPELPVEFQTLRLPHDESWLQCGSDKGLRLYGRESLSSRHHTSLIARRVEHFDCRTETTVHINARDYQHMAGLVAMYDTASWLYCYVSVDDDGNRAIRLAVCNDGAYNDSPVGHDPLPDDEPIELAVEIIQLRLMFFYRVPGGTWIQAYGPKRCHMLGDEHGRHGHFTGAMVGIACQDLSGQQAYADFSRFRYEPVAMRDTLAAGR